VGKGARKKGPKQASDRKPKVRDVFVGQPFEGLAAEPELIAIPTDQTDTTTLRLLGTVEIPAPVDASVSVWWLRQYAGGLFVPLRDGTAGETSYGGGRYLLDTAKGADLGGGPETLVIDLNFLYHPSCRYNPAWQCPLAPPGNVIEAPVRGGERL